MVLLQNHEKSEFLLEVFWSPSFSAPISEMNNDADFHSGWTTDDCDGGPYSYLNFKK